MPSGNAIWERSERRDNRGTLVKSQIPHVITAHCLLIVVDWGLFQEQPRMSRDAIYLVVIGLVILVAAIVVTVALRF
jgi:hypothetical protein